MSNKEELTEHKGLRLELNNLKTLEGWINLAKMFRPKFYNKLTWLIVAAGVGLLSTSLIEMVISELLDRSFNITMLDGNEGMIGLVLIGFGLMYNLACQFIEAYEKSGIRSNRKLNEDAHDRELFSKLESLLDEATLKQTLDWVAANHFYMENQWAMLSEFLHELSKTSNKMLNSDIESSRIQLHTQLDSLMSFFGKHFFYRSGTRHVNDNNHYLYPDLNPDMTGDYNSKGRDTYFVRGDELVAHIEELRSSYDQYRDRVKKHLYC